MEGTVDCGNVDERGLEILRPMFACRPRPSSSSASSSFPVYCGSNGTKVNSTETEEEVAPCCDAINCSHTNENETDSGKRLRSITSKESHEFYSPSTGLGDLDVSLTRDGVGKSQISGKSCKSRTSPNIKRDNSRATLLNGSISPNTSISHREENEYYIPNCDQCQFNIDKESIGLIEQLNEKLRLGQSVDKETSEHLGLATKAISRLNGCRPKYPSSLGEMPNLCLSKHNHDLDTQVSFKEMKSSAKCDTSNCANPSCQHLAHCKPDNWYPDSLMSNGVGGFLGLNAISTPTGCYQLNCQSEHCQSRLPRVEEPDYISRVSNPIPADSIHQNALFQPQSNLNLVSYVGYESETQMPDIMRLIQKDLSEPYSVYTYRYFIHNWPHLCYLALIENVCVGAIVCKLDMHKKNIRRGYIAMLAVDEKYRKKRIGSNLVLKAIQAMIADDADEVVLETEITNKPALQLYENLGFVRDKRLFRYYLNGVDALRLKLWLR